ncbi:GATA-like domain-containing protein [Aspergillus stella-maris]|uniref:GATA-like domain-containing protein n=1 Tax=Aspergillus stella-maris TaxID=1810926 RepID=UPI003CCCB353
MESLPKGLVSVSGKVSAELKGIGVDAVDVGDIVQLWKAYSTNPSAHEGDAGHRLQNFFWRIWSSKPLSSSLTGSTLARLFLQISEPTTRPGPSPFTKQSAPHSPSSSLKHAERQIPGHPSSVATTITTTTKPPLQPILKKSNSSSHGETQKSTRLLLTGLGGQSVTHKPSNPPTPIPPSKPVTFVEQQASRLSQKKGFAVASKAKSAKRRPVMMRRKSSQQSSVSSTRNHSPQFSPPVTGPLEVPLVQENELDEEAVEDSPDGMFIPTHLSSFLCTKRFLNCTPEPLVSPKMVNLSSNPPTIPSTIPDPAPNPIATVSEPTNLELTTDEQTTPLPPAFVDDLKDLLHKSTPLPTSSSGPSLRQRSSQPSQPTVGFFSATACRHFDIRYLKEENYKEQPSTSSLVDRDFRTKFTEQKKAADEWYQRYREQFHEQEQSGSGGGAASGNSRRGSGTETRRDSGLSGFIPPSTLAEAPEPEEEQRPGTGTETEETVSPTKSRYGDSHRSHPQSHGASTIATSILTSPGSGSLGGDADLEYHNPFSSGEESALSPGFQHQSQLQPGTSSPMAVPVPGTAPANPFLQTSTLSVPRGPSGLSLLISQSRNSIYQGSRRDSGTRGEGEEGS